MLYLSQRIVRTKARYYELLQIVRDQGRWEDWGLYMLDGVETTARQTMRTIAAIREVLLDHKHRIRSSHRFYSQDLINNLFMHPYTKIEFVQHDLGASRVTATKYLDALAATGFVRKVKIGRGSYYINEALHRILVAGASGTNE